MRSVWNDPGFPIPVLAADGTGVALDTVVCGAVGCPTTTLHLVVRPVTPAGRNVRLDYGAPTVELLWDAQTGALTTGDGASAAGALARVPGASGVEAWIAEHEALLRQRFERLRAQIDWSYLDHPAPPWRPGERVLHAELFRDFTPYVVVDGRVWTIQDAVCPDPACPCVETSLLLRSQDGEEESLDGVLGHASPKTASKQGLELWAAIAADEELLERLEERRRDVRGAGAFVVAAAYERARRERAQRCPGPSGSSGYLRGGEVPTEAVAKLFEVAAKLEAADAWDCMPPGWLVRADVSGAARETVWVATDGAECLELLEGPSVDSRRSTSLSLIVRSDARWEHLRERCANDWPLVGDGELPLLLRHDCELDRAQPPSAQETVVAVAVCAAFAQHERAIRELAVRVEEDEEVEPGRFESELALPGGNLRVQLTAPDPSVPWAATEPEDDDLSGGALDGEDGWEDEDGWDEDEPDPRESVRVAREAFVDWALTCGRPEAEVTLAALLVDSLAELLHAEDAAAVWYDARAVEGFLTRYAPRKLSLEDEQIEGTHAALEALGEWLVEVGHLDAERASAWRAVVAGAMPVYRARMRDPEYFGLAKGLFVGMMRAGVDVSDRAAVDRYIAAMNLATTTTRVRASPAAPDPQEPSPHRWRPADGEKPPPPTAPCPCGSGRRYKKCCKPR